MSLLGLEKLKNPKGRGVVLPGVIPATGMREIIAKRKQGFSWEQINDKLPARFKYGSGTGLCGVVVAWWRENEPATAPRSRKAATVKRKKRKRHFSESGLKAVRKNAVKARAARAAQLRNASKNGRHTGELVAAAASR